MQARKKSRPGLSSAHLSPSAHARRQTEPQETLLFSPSKGGEFQVVLFYPNTYQMGASNLGFHTVYRILSGLPGVLCERAFLPENPADPILTLESRRPLSAFHLIAASISFELDIFNFISALQKTGLSPLAAEREELFPLVAAGGAVTFFNPEPMAPFVDFFRLGEAESGFAEVIAVLRDSGGREKGEILRELAAGEGIYVPSLYRPVYDPKGKLREVEPLLCAPFPLKLHYNARFTPGASAFLSPKTEFASTYLLEVSRGCPHRCLFCAYSWNYPPFAYASFSDLQPHLELAKAAGGKIGLIAADLLSCRELPQLAASLEAGDFKLGFSSFRAEKLTPEFLHFLVKGGVKTLTLAPEAGEERTRLLLGKALGDEKILELAREAWRAGLKHLKLYFLTGLPPLGGLPPSKAAEADLEAIAGLVQKIRQLKTGLSVTLSLNPLIPKPFTPLMWAPLPDPKTVQEQIKRLKKRLPGVKVGGESPREAFIQGILARGGRELAPALLEAAREGDFRLLPDLLEATGLILGNYSRELSPEHIFPFEHLRKKLDKTAFYRLYLKYRSQSKEG